jgi:hypothetical protein
MFSPLINSYLETSIFSPVLPIMSSNACSIVKLFNVEAIKAEISEGLLIKACLAIEFAKATKSSFLATKSVSQFNSMITPVFLSSDVKAITAPSLAALSALFNDIF